MGAILIWLCIPAAFIGTIFALDKTNLPPLAVYAVLLAALAALTTLNCRRIRKEDLRA